VINYQKIDDTNRIMCVDTSTSSVSLAGLNFPNTDLIIFDRVNNRFSLKPATMIQAIGRAIRPQAPREGEGARSALREDYYSWLVDVATQNRADFEPIELEPPESTFPEKLVVFLDSA
jgi:replicative superfamily II helicase